jgi:ABC-type transporter Mla subunit MlaD
MTATLSNIAGLSDEARQGMSQLGPELSATLTATRQAATRLDAVGQEIGPVLRESGQLVQHAGRRLDTLAGEAETTLRMTRDTLKNLDAGLRDTQVQLRLSADLGLQELQGTAQTLRAAGESLQATSRDFADPGRILFGPNKGELGPGEN